MTDKENLMKKCDCGDACECECCGCDEEKCAGCDCGCDCSDCDDCEDCGECCANDQTFFDEPGVQVGSTAPYFCLEGVEGGKDCEYSLPELKGKWVVLFFYPADFTFVCPTEVKGFQEKLKEFKDRNVQVLGCSVDSAHVHRAWAESLGGVDYPLLADVHHFASIDYNVFNPVDANTYRGTYIIDPNGTLKWYQVSDNNVGRNVEEIVRVIDALQTDKLTPCGWSKGEKTIN